MSDRFGPVFNAALAVVCGAIFATIAFHIANGEENSEKRWIAQCVVEGKRAEDCKAMYRGGIR